MLVDVITGRNAEIGSYLTALVSAQTAKKRKHFGSRQTSNFCKQYCDKKTFLYSLCELKISIHGFLS
jgi:hypothetical protein